MAEFFNDFVCWRGVEDVLLDRYILIIKLMK